MRITKNWRGKKQISTKNREKKMGISSKGHGKNYELQRFEEKKSNFVKKPLQNCRQNIAQKGEFKKITAKKSCTQYHKKNENFVKESQKRIKTRRFCQMATNLLIT